MIIEQKGSASSGLSRPLYFLNYSSVKGGTQIQHNQEKSLTMTENHQNVIENAQECGLRGAVLAISRLKRWDQLLS